VNPVERDSSGVAPTVLRMSAIGKSFAGTRALDNVDFDLRSGEVHVLAGENGAGKTTLIKILGGVHTEYEGAIQLNGKPAKFKSPQHAAEHGIAVIHQELSLIPSMSVADNIFLGRERSAALGWMNYASQRRACETLMKQLGLDIDVRRNVGDYPISVCQTIEVAKALAVDARIIVMDEPTSALTEPEVERLFSTIAGLTERGCGVVYISHKMEEIYRIADRITVLRDGRHIGTAPVQDLPRAQMIHWMVGRQIDEQFPRHTPRVGAPRLEVANFTVPDPAGRQKPAVDNVTFSVHAGEILGIGGLQGSGASELLNGLFGAYGPTPRGNVLLEGRPFAIRSPKHAIDNGMALLTNDRKTSGLVLDMSVTNNVTLASVPRYSPGWWIRNGLEKQCAINHRDALGIRTTTLDHPVAALSGGNQQKVVLAKWLATTPNVMLLDEPTRGVDVGAKHEIYELMNQWTDRGIAILLITSEMPELLALSDRIIVMHRGKITAEFQQNEATQENILAAAMGHQRGEAANTRCGMEN